VWIAFKNDEYTLLDGVHRIVATHLENKPTVPSYVINVNDESI
jgi:ParB-like chromosome segregation protein Spo0J